jgi:hypothetical protein
MTELSTADAVGYAKEYAIKAWRLFTQERNFRAKAPDWRETTTPDGSPSLTAEVVGPGAAHALRLFTADYHVRLDYPGDQRPTFDYSTEGRVACVWRKYGVWIELWIPDSVRDLPAPVPSVSRRLLKRPAGRFPFTRRLKESRTA